MIYGVVRDWSVTVTAIFWTVYVQYYPGLCVVILVHFTIDLYKTHNQCKMSETWGWILYCVELVASITSRWDYMYHAVSVVKLISYPRHLALSQVLPEIHRLSWGTPSTSVYFRFFRTRAGRFALRLKTKVDLEERKWLDNGYCIYDDWNLVIGDIFGIFWKMLILRRPFNHSKPLEHVQGQKMMCMG